MASHTLTDPIAVLNQEVLTHTAPLFLNDPFLTRGHSRATPNATLTFLAYRDVVYGVTCAHVLDEVKRIVPGQDQRVLQLMVDRCVLHLGQFDASGFRHSFKRLTDHTDPSLDLAVMIIPPPTWALLQARKGKVAIDLARMGATDPTALRMGVAFGYPDEHKAHVAEPDGRPMVAAGLAMVVASLNPLREPDRLVTLSEELAQAHGYYLSGMSGGPIYGEDANGDCHFLGIVTEGAPGSFQAWKARDGHAFLTDASVLVRGVRVTPERWAHWLNAATD